MKKQPPYKAKAHTKPKNTIWAVLDSSGVIVEASHDKALLPAISTGEKVIKLKVVVD